MNNRKAFSLTELLVVMGIIAILVAILVPVVVHTRNQADIVAQKSDFQAITNALENYRQDFGDYPRNRALPTWNYDVGATPPNYEAPAEFSLAALVSPGPASTIFVGNPPVEEFGDGATGAGFRTQNQIFSTTTNGLANAGDPNFEVTALPPAWTSPSTSAAQLLQLLTNTTVEIDSGTNIDETVGLDTATPGKNYPSPGTRLYLSRANGGTSLMTLRYTHAANAPVLIKTSTGKVWPSYLPADKFKIAYITVGNFSNANSSLTGPSTYLANTTSQGQAYEIVGQPVLLDRWGQIIQYFTRVGPNNNRTDLTNSTYQIAHPGPNSPLPIPNVVGPLLGYSSPRSVYSGSPTFPTVPRYGYNSIWDTRDGVMFLNGPTGGTSVAPWTPSILTPGNYDPQIAFQWMLGDDDGDNLIDNGETLRYDRDFILISAGPNKFRPEFGGFCNMLLGDGTINQITAAQKADTFKQYGNIYNFDR
jgi:prepilin-type N-terminal cleavage/methylation domain-containing protein